MGGACSTHGKHEKYMHIFSLKPEVKRPFGGPNLEMDLKIVGCENVECIHLADKVQWQALVYRMMSLRVP
jgi:hypothetical protein